MLTAEVCFYKGDRVLVEANTEEELELLIKEETEKREYEGSEDFCTVIGYRC